METHPSSQSRKARPGRERSGPASKAGSAGGAVAPAVGSSEFLTASEAAELLDV